MERLPDGKRIRRLRETRKHYSQAGLAEAAGCSIGTIIRIEKGLATNQGTLERIAKALNVHSNEITITGNWAKRLPSSSQLAAILDCIRPSENWDLTFGKPRQRLGPMDERAQGVLALLVSLGVIRIQGREPRAVSDLSDAFLASLRAHLRGQGRHYFGHWNAGPTTPTGRKLAALIRSCEEHRIQTTETAARKVRAALGLIRADRDKQPCFLMLKEPTWNPEGAWWFVGGLEKACDGGDLAQTMLRETREELAFEVEDSAEVQSLGKTADLRISGRLGILTSYQYHLFQIKGKGCPALSRLLFPEPKIEVYASGHSTFARTHQFRWFSWKELLRLEHLANHAPPVLALLRKINPFQLPSIGTLG